MAGPTLVSDVPGTKGYYDGLSFDLACGAGSVGQPMLAWISMRTRNGVPSSSDIPDTQAGWTRIAKKATTNGNDDKIEFLFARIREAGDSTWTFVSTGDGWVGTFKVESYEGCPTTIAAAIGAVDGDAVTANTTDHKGIGLTTLGDNSLVIVGWTDLLSENSPNPPTGMTSHAGVQKNGAGGGVCFESRLQTASELFASAGATGDFAATSAVSDDYATISVELRSATVAIVPSPVSLDSSTVDPSIASAVDLFITPPAVSLNSDFFVDATRREIRDIFAAYNPSLDEYHLFVVRMVRQTKGFGTSWASVASQPVELQANEFIVRLADLGVGIRRFVYDHSLPSAVQFSAPWQSSPESSAYQDRPDAMLVGFHSFGPSPTYFQAVEGDLVWEASVPWSEASYVDPSTYPGYGVAKSPKPGLTLGPEDFGEPHTFKRMKRITLWVIPRSGLANTGEITVTITPYGVESQAGASGTVQRTIEVEGYDATNGSIWRPARRVYIDFDPYDSDTEVTPAGESFEVDIEFTGLVGLRAFDLEAVALGQVNALHYDAGEI